MKSRTEETQYLRESLSRTRDRLDQEKRLNKAIKQRKVFEHFFMKIRETLSSDAKIKLDTSCNIQYSKLILVHLHD